MCRVLHKCGHAYTPGLWLGGCPWCALAPRADTPTEGRYFDLHDGNAYVSGAQLLAAHPDLPTLRDILAAMRSGQTDTIGDGHGGILLTRVL